MKVSYSNQELSIEAYKTHQTFYKEDLKHYASKYGDQVSYHQAVHSAFVDCLCEDEPAIYENMEMQDWERLEDAIEASWNDRKNILA